MKKIHLTCVSLIGMFHLREDLVLSVHATVDDDTLALCIIRSWTGKETTTQTSSRLPTLAFVKPSRQMRRRTPLCLPEHSRTKPSMCTGSRKNAWRVARICQRAEQHTSNSRNSRQYLEEENTFVISPSLLVSSLRSSQLWSCLLFLNKGFRALWAGSTWRLHCFG